MLYINSIRDNLISASPFLVSLPFTITDTSKFDVNEEQALWQPPGYVFGIVWPTLYVLLFMMNKQIFSSGVITEAFKNKVRFDTIFESILQGSWLYIFSYNPSVKGRTQNQKFWSVGILASILGFGLYRISGFIRYFKSFSASLPILKYYIPYFTWITLANILGIQLYLGITK
jgi:tryptophan-rich sensory protein